MFRVILVDDNKLTTYLLYHFMNTAAASQAKWKYFFIDRYKNVAVDEILPWLEVQSFAKPMSFDVVVLVMQSIHIHLFGKSKNNVWHWKAY